MKFAICNEMFQGWKIDDVLRYAAGLGYAAVEVAPFTLADNVEEVSASERRRIRDAAAALGLEIAGIHWVLVSPKGLYINCPDAAVRARTARYFVALTRFCADLGGRVMVVGSPKQRDVMEGVSFEQAWEWAAETFRPAVKEAEERGVVICFEPLAPVETNFINTAADAIRFVQQVPSPAFQIILDVKAMSAESKPIPQIIRESAGRFAHFHANDPNLKGPGMGEMDFVPIFRALKEVGYDGYVSVEVFDFTDGPETIASRSLQYMKQASGGE
ncbi:MAG: sugar phosphate isomerase/epimerase family protein [Armatimonadota bacterium]|nr:sugar phosphate isomerase/epimerase family protein [Armatimonadota bacterium]